VDGRSSCRHVRACDVIAHAHERRASVQHGAASSVAARASAVREPPQSQPPDPAAVDVVEQVSADVDADSDIAAVWRAYAPDTCARVACAESGASVVYSASAAERARVCAVG
jgi:hypothetical protein